MANLLCRWSTLLFGRALSRFLKWGKILHLCQQFFICLQKMEPCCLLFYPTFLRCSNSTLPQSASPLKGHINVLCRFQGTVGTVIIKRVGKLDKMLQAPSFFCSKFPMKLVNLISITQTTATGRRACFQVFIPNLLHTHLHTCKVTVCLI